MTQAIKDINGNPYLAICKCCDKTFKSHSKGFEHADKTDHDVYFCEESEG